jgi:hypothetical protein
LTLSPDEDEVFEVIFRAKLHKAPGPDRIRIDIIRDVFRRYRAGPPKTDEELEEQYVRQWVGSDAPVREDALYNRDDPYERRAAIYDDAKALSLAVVDIVQHAFEKGEIPAAWGRAEIVPLPKVPSPAKPGEYRGISLISTAWWRP